MLRVGMIATAAVSRYAPHSTSPASRTAWKYAVASLEVGLALVLNDTKCLRER
jgi:hypothetical protein